MGSRMKQLYRSSTAWTALLLGILITTSLQTEAQAQGLSLYLPLLQATVNGQLGIAFSNPTSSDAHVTLTARAYDGSVISTHDTIVPAGGQYANDARTIFESAIVNKTGWIQMQSDVAALKGLFTAYDSAVTYIDGAELQSVPASSNDHLASGDLRVADNLIRIAQRNAIPRKHVHQRVMHERGSELAFEIITNQRQPGVLKLARPFF